VGLVAPGKAFDGHSLRGDDAHFYFVKDELLFGVAGSLRSEPVCLQLVKEGSSLGIHARVEADACQLLSIGELAGYVTATGGGSSRSIHNKLE